MYGCATGAGRRRTTERARSATSPLALSPSFDRRRRTPLPHTLLRSVSAEIARPTGAPVSPG
ncbi:hypothetical protein GCM10018772_21060 [Streptomyces fumanus]|uniref:Uncharacterized protein n=1 Tax=Streptomyces fumanus TaxID=67302 RepID=A0A919DXZ8_9ACTN|nr:hypothetical protein GCM10018772_21060 [Streptomyces fumanus]